MQQYKAEAHLDLCWNINSTPQKGPLIHSRIFLVFMAYFSTHTQVLTTKYLKQGRELELYYFQLTCSATDILLLGSTSRPSNLALTRFHTLTAYEFLSCTAKGTKQD